MPVLLAGSCAGDALFAAQRSGPAVEAGFFFTGMILTSIIALPVMYYLLGWLSAEVCLFTSVGSFMVLTAAFSYQLLFNSGPSDDY